MARPLPRVFARIVQDKIDTLPEGIDKEAVRAHFKDILERPERPERPTRERENTPPQ